MTGFCRLVSTALFLICVCLSPHSLANENLEKKVEELCRPLTRHGALMGLSVGIITDKKSHTQAFGRVEAGSDIVPDEHTIYEIGSITKVFTGLLMARMIEDKLIKAGDPVESCLPTGMKMPRFGEKQITLLHLATHHSGLPRMPGNFTPADPANPYADYTFAMMADFLAKHKLITEPGDHYLYSNLGVGLLGQALAHKSGGAYEELLRSRILKPLGMNETSVTLNSEMSARLAKGEGLDGHIVKNWDLSVFVGAGGIRSSVHDMLIFASANIGLSETALQAAMKMSQKRQRDTERVGHGIALGWHIRPDGIVWHNGQTGGYHSFFALNGKTQEAVVVLSNTASKIVDELGGKLIEVLKGWKVEPIKFRKTIELKGETLEVFVGRYAMTPEFILTVTREGDELMVQATGQSKFRVYPESGNRFFYKVVDAQISFTVGKDGSATGLVLHQNGKDMAAERLAAGSKK